MSKKNEPRMDTNEHKLIRVFARRTRLTPSDDRAFYGEPPMAVRNFNKGTPVAVSCTFTWDKARAFELYRAWSFHFNNVLIGGPAFDDPGKSFIPGRFVKKGVTFTSRGCTKRCPWCLAWRREGYIRELPIHDGYIVNDNNLLACSREHIEKVFDMLAGQRRGIQFKGGLDIDLMEPWHIELLKNIKVSDLWVACDTMGAMNRLPKAVDLLSDFSIEKKRCYVLVGYGGESMALAQRRCEWILKQGFLPFAQLYRSENAGPSRGEWHDFCHYWSKPGLYRNRDCIEIKSSTENRQLEMTDE